MRTRKNIIYFCRNEERHSPGMSEINANILKLLENFSVVIIYYGSQINSIIRKLRLEKFYFKLLKLLFKPSLMLFMDESSSTGFARRARLNIKAPSVNISHAMVSDKPFYKNLDFDYYFIYGEKCLRSIKRFSINSNKTKCIPIGPFYSSIRALSMKRNFHDLIKLFIIHEQNTDSIYKPRFCITSQWWNSDASSEFIPIYTQLSTFILKRTDFLFYIKPHPLEKDNNSPLSVLKESLNVEFLSKGASLADMVGLIDLNITVYSNSIIDFALLGIPTLFLAFETNYADHYGIIPSNYPLIAKNIEELEKILYCKTYSKCDAFKILEHNTGGRGFESIKNFKAEIVKILENK